MNIYIFQFVVFNLKIMLYFIPFYVTIYLHLWRIMNLNENNLIKILSAFFNIFWKLTITFFYSSSSIKIYLIYVFLLILSFYNILLTTMNIEKKKFWFIF